MNIFETFLGVLEQGLILWNSKEKTKYLDEMIELKKDYYEEINKPEDFRDDAVLDNIRARVCIIGVAFNTGSSSPDATNQPNKSGA